MSEMRIKARYDMLCAECGRRALIPENVFDGKCPSCGAPYTLLTCTRCSNVWRMRGSRCPRVCPLCKSPYWNRERIR